jgi:hypothetical protein
MYVEISSEGLEIGYRDDPREVLAYCQACHQRFRDQGTPQRRGLLVGRHARMCQLRTVFQRHGSAFILIHYQLFLSQDEKYPPEPLALLR